MSFLKSNFHFTIEYFKLTLNSYLHIQLCHRIWCKLFSRGTVNGFNIGTGDQNNPLKLALKYSSQVIFLYNYKDNSFI